METCSLMPSLATSSAVVLAATGRNPASTVRSALRGRTAIRSRARVLTSRRRPALSGTTFGLPAAMVTVASFAFRSTLGSSAASAFRRRLGSIFPASRWESSRVKVRLAAIARGEIMIFRPRW